MYLKYSKGGYDLLYATISESIRGYCGEFSALTDSSAGFLVCHHLVIKNPVTNELNEDFYLSSDQISLCT